VLFDVGMTLTDEPGYYEDGAFGIRIENVLIAQQTTTPCRFGGHAYLVSRLVALDVDSRCRAEYALFFYNAGL
jgi:Xaa-Pro aminopeptidase